MKSLIRALLVLLCLESTSAIAVDGISRACPFDQIPLGTKSIAAQLLIEIGAPPSIANIPSFSISDQHKYWVLESLTTDYLRVRYWLFAASAQYKLSVDSFGNFSYSHFRTITSEWTATQISQAIQADPKYQPFFLNRGLLYSARAGMNAIVEYFPDTAGIAKPFYVVGVHYYYDPVNKTISNSSSSTATSCNLTQWGFGYR